jgi:hypothetical protein
VSVPSKDLEFQGRIPTVVKELRSKMFGQHPGYFNALDTYFLFNFLNDLRPQTEILKILCFGRTRLTMRIRNIFDVLSLYTVRYPPCYSYFLFQGRIPTVVKELRSKMFGQHPGYFKAVFLKQTRIIIVSIYKYTVYIMF